MYVSTLHGVWFLLQKCEREQDSIIFNIFRFTQIYKLKKLKYYLHNLKS
jgi:hypothetical protein